MPSLDLIGLALGAAFAAGLNLYATAALLGAAQRFGGLPLPGELGVLAEPPVLVAACVLYLVEFAADKVPWVDSAWDAVHTVLRPLAGSAIALGLFQGLPPTWQVIGALVAGTVALTAHGAKAGTRVLANTSPEPFSNWLLSALEDLLAAGLTALAVHYPVAAGATVLVLLVLALWLIRTVWRAVGRLAGRGRVSARRTAGP